MDGRRINVGYKAKNYYGVITEEIAPQLLTFKLIKCYALVKPINRISKKGWNQNWFDTEKDARDFITKHEGDR